ncbi:hypothetical protein G6F57_012330 [Rhizopus arrhizus]|nr:hypothetical protein G6F57_012330 [Rhizopus arrhizus]
MSAPDPSAPGDVTTPPRPGYRHRRHLRAGAADHRIHPDLGLGRIARFRTPAHVADSASALRPGHRQLAGAWCGQPLRQVDGHDHHGGVCRHHAVVRADRLGEVVLDRQHDRGGDLAVDAAVAATGAVVPAAGRQPDPLHLPLSRQWRYSGHEDPPSKRHPDSAGCGLAAVPCRLRQQGPAGTAAEAGAGGRSRRAGCRTGHRGDSGADPGQRNSGHDRGPGRTDHPAGVRAREEGGGREWVRPGPAPCASARCKAGAMI